MDYLIIGYLLAAAGASLGFAAIVVGVGIAWPFFVAFSIIHMALTDD